MGACQENCTVNATRLSYGKNKYKLISVCNFAYLLLWRVRIIFPVAPDVKCVL